jgi:hypothetical protein
MRIEPGYVYFHNGSHCNSKRASKSIEAAVMVSFKHRGRTLRAEFWLGVALVGEDDGLGSDVVEDGLVDETREVDILEDEGGVSRLDDIGVSGLDGVEGGVSRLEGIGMDEVNDGTGVAKEPDMLSMLDDRAGSDDHKRRGT